MTSPSFTSLGVPAALAAVLAADGKTEPFPIQADTLPDTLAGLDVLGRGRTGSGKTIAFALPIVARLTDGQRPAGRRPRALVLAPTRELATQITATIEPLATAVGLTVTTIFGGVSSQRQTAALRAGVDIVVACPGRLEDLMRQGDVKLDSIEITVLDEADHMADLGFLPGVTRILSATPTGAQRLLFSATLDNGVDVLVKRFLQNPVLHSVDEANSPVAAMTHHVFEVESPAGKTALVRTLASGTGRRILFMRTKHHAKRLARQLTEGGIPAVDLHGNLSQGQRDRNLAAFSDGTSRVLVATDVAARGVHVDDVELVVHVDPPMEHKAYLHRSGRTARAGAEGDVVTVVLPEQRRDTAALLRKAAIDVQPQRVTAESPAVAALVGEVAPHVEPTAQPVQQHRGGGQGGRGRGQAQGQRTGQRSGGGQRAGSGQRAASGQRSTQGQLQGQRQGERSAQRLGRMGQSQFPAQPPRQRSTEGESSAPRTPRGQRRRAGRPAGSARRDG